jgi:hypothetical protein
MHNRTFDPLVVAVVGVSTPFVHWCFDLITRIVGALTTDSTVRFHVGTLSQLRNEFDQRNSGSVVITADLPEAELAHFVCASGIPIIAIADDLVDTLMWVKMSRKMSELDAIKFCTLNLSTLAPALLDSRVIHIDASHRDDPESAVAKIVEYLFPTSSETLAATTFAYIVESGFTARPNNLGQGIVLRVEEYAQEVDQRVLRSSTEALASYSSLLAGIWPVQIIWPIALFYTFENHPPYAAFDLAGPPRTLLYGPYLHLPKGTWAARVEFEISEALSGVETTTDVRVHQTVIEKKFEMPANGIFAYEMIFDITDPWHEVEIRIHMTKGAIEGIFLPRSVVLRPLNDTFT